MNDWKHLGGVDDAIDFEIGGIEVLAFLDGLLIVVALGEPLIMGLIEAVDLVLHIFPQAIDFRFCEPGSVKVAPSFVFDEVFLLIGILPFSSP